MYVPPLATFGRQVAFAALLAIGGIGGLAACSSSSDDGGEARDAGGTLDATVDDAGHAGDAGDGAEGGGGPVEGGALDGGDASSVDGPIVCHTAAPPPDGGAWSPPDAGAATVCVTAGNCAPAQGCVTGMCAACTQNADCGEGETRAAGVCKAAACTGASARTLQQIVDGADAGAAVTVPACVFRESIVLSKPIALVARPGAEIRGSDLWSTWTAGSGSAAGTWTSTAVIPSPVAGDANDACHCVECDKLCAANQTCTSPSEANCACAKAARCYLPQQVFVDDVPLTQVASGTPALGEFVVDLGTGSVTLATATDPNKSRVEVTTRRSWLTAAGSLKDVTVEGFTMRHAASPPQKGALDTTGGTCGVKDGVTGGWLVKNNRLLYAAGGALLPNAYDRIIGNELGWNGQEGASSTCFDHGLMQGNYIHDNNTENFDADWEAAGVKGTKTIGAVYDGNIVTNNRAGAAGLWADINTFGTTYINNYIAGNSGSGIQYEISDTASIRCNDVENNGASVNGCGGTCGAAFFGGAQIFVSASPNVTIAQNSVTGAMGIGVLQQYRSDACVCPDGGLGCCSPGVCSDTSTYHQIKNVVVTDNDITETQSASAKGVVSGLAMDVCTSKGCAAKSPGAAAGESCDGGSFYEPATLTFSGNRYHVSSCDDRDWYWQGTYFTFGMWSGDMDAGGETCAP